MLHIRRWPRWLRADVLRDHPSCERFGVQRHLDVNEPTPPASDVVLTVFAEEEPVSLDDAAERLGACLGNADGCTGIVLLDGVDRDGSVHTEERIVFTSLAAAMPPTPPSEDEPDWLRYPSPEKEPAAEPSVPEPSAPEPSAPEAPAPEPSAPEALAPEPSAPEAPTPEPSAPEAPTPEPSAPEAPAPEPPEPEPPEAPAPELPEPSAPKPPEPEPPAPEPPEAPAPELPEPSAPEPPETPAPEPPEPPAPEPPASEPFDEHTSPGRACQTDDDAWTRVFLDGQEVLAVPGLLPPAVLTSLADQRVVLPARGPQARVAIFRDRGRVRFGPYAVDLNSYKPHIRAYVCTGQMTSHSSLPPERRGGNVARRHRIRQQAYERR